MRIQGKRKTEMYTELGVNDIMPMTWLVLYFHRTRAQIGSELSLVLHGEISTEPDDHTSYLLGAVTLPEKAS